MDRLFSAVTQREGCGISARATMSASDATGTPTIGSAASDEDKTTH
jgi:hypothetical protein